MTPPPERRLPIRRVLDPAPQKPVGDQLRSAHKTLAAFCLSLPARNERGESRREGKLIGASSPRPSPPFVRRRGRDLLPNRTDRRPTLHFALSRWWRQMPPVRSDSAAVQRGIRHESAGQQPERLRSPFRWHALCLWTGRRV